MPKTEQTSIVDRIESARRQIRELSKEIFEKKGVTASQAQVLCALLKKNGVAQKDIVEMTGVDRTTVTEVVTLLVEKGFIKRRRNASDTRAYVITLTIEGRRLAYEIREIP